MVHFIIEILIGLFGKYNFLNMKYNNRSITTEDPCGIPFDQLISDKNIDDSTEKLLTGVPEMDYTCGGFHAEGLVVIAGRPVMGHKMLALTIARNMSMVFGIPTAYVSMDYNEKTLAQRIMQSISVEVGTKIELDGKSYSTANLIGGKHPPLYLLSMTRFSCKSIEDLCQKMVEKRGVRTIFLDTPEDMCQLSKTYDFYELGKKLKSIALRLGICIVAVSHLSRALETRGGAKIPMLSDLSCGFELHANRVLLLYRPSYYGIVEDEDGPTQSRASIFVYDELFVGDAPYGKVIVGFDSQHGTFDTHQLIRRAAFPQCSPSQNLEDYREWLFKIATQDHGFQFNIQPSKEWKEKILSTFRDSNPQIDFLQFILPQ